MKWKTAAYIMVALIISLTLPHGYFGLSLNDENDEGDASFSFGAGVAEGNGPVTIREGDVKEDYEFSGSTLVGYGQECDLEGKYVCVAGNIDINIVKCEKKFAQGTKWVAQTTKVGIGEPRTDSGLAACVNKCGSMFGENCVQPAIKTTVDYQDGNLIIKPIPNDKIPSGRGSLSVEQPSPINVVHLCNSEPCIISIPVEGGQTVQFRVKADVVTKSPGTKSTIQTQVYEFTAIDTQVTVSAASFSNGDTITATITDTFGDRSSSDLACYYSVIGGIKPFVRKRQCGTASIELRVGPGRECDTSSSTCTISSSINAREDPKNLAFDSVTVSISEGAGTQPGAGAGAGPTTTPGAGGTTSGSTAAATVAGIHITGTQLTPPQPKENEQFTISFNLNVPEDAGFKNFQVHIFDEGNTLVRGPFTANRILCPPTCGVSMRLNAGNYFYVAAIIDNDDNRITLKREEFSIGSALPGLPSGTYLSLAACEQCVERDGKYCVWNSFGQSTPYRGTCLESEDQASCYTRYQGGRLVEEVAECSARIPTCSEMCRTSSLSGGLNLPSTGRIPISTGTCSTTPPGQDFYSRVNVQGTSFLPGQSQRIYGASDCRQEEGEFCYCQTHYIQSTFLQQQQQSLDVGELQSGAPQVWENPKALEDVPLKRKTDFVCDLDDLEDVTIRAQLTPELAEIGETVTVSGDIGSKSATCNGYEYTCQRNRILPCKVEKNKFGIWDYEIEWNYQKCPADLDEILHQEGQKSETLWGNIISSTLDLAKLGIAIGMCVSGACSPELILASVADLVNQGCSDPVSTYYRDDILTKRALDDHRRELLEKQREQERQAAAARQPAAGEEPAAAGTGELAAVGGERIFTSSKCRKCLSEGDVWWVPEGDTLPLFERGVCKPALSLPPGDDYTAIRSADKCPDLQSSASVSAGEEPAGVEPEAENLITGRQLESGTGQPGGGGIGVGSSGAGVGPGTLVGGSSGAGSVGSGAGSAGSSAASSATPDIGGFNKFAGTAVPIIGAASQVACQADLLRGIDAPEACFRVCGDTYETNPIPQPSCRLGGDVIEADEATYECNLGSCGGLEKQDVRIDVYDSKGKIIQKISGVTKTDSQGSFSYTFPAPQSAGEFSVVISIPGLDLEDRATGQVTAIRSVSDGSAASYAVKPLLDG